jgi:dTDP-4-amino-4,6-dideoxygalactose transaminase
MSEALPLLVPLLDLKAQYQTIRKEIRQAVDDVLESQRFILGPRVADFEKCVASYLDCKAAVGVASGSDALLLALMALDIGPGDGVLVPTFTFFATASCIARLSATPIFIDSDPTTYLVSQQTVGDALQGAEFDPKHGAWRHHRSGSRIKALIPVHLFGQACSMESLAALATSYRLSIVEDAAQAMGALCAGGVSKYAGTIGDLGCFSFFPTKTLGGIGDGGLVATNDQDLAEKIRCLRMHGEASRYYHELIGVNSRLDALQARVLEIKLRYLEGWCAERVMRAATYHNLFTAAKLVNHGIIQLPAAGAGRSHVFNYYVIRVERRDRLKQYLTDHGIQSEVYYPVPLHLQPCFSYLGYRRGDFPSAESIAAEVLALPMYPELTLQQQELVVRTIGDFFHS